MKALALFIICILVALTLIACFGYSAAKQQIQSEDSQAQTAHTPNKKDYPSLIVALKLGFIRIGQCLHTYRDDVIAFSTVTMAIFTIILGLATVYLSGATRDLVNEGKKTAEQQLRAYVFVRPTATDLRPDGKAISIKYSIENTGDTPAYNIRHASEIRVLPFLLPEKYVVASPKDFIGGQSLGKGVPLGGQALKEIDIAAAQGGIYLVITVTYESFQRTRTTRFCAGADIPGIYRDYLAKRVKDPAAESTGSVDWYYPTQHNDSD